MPTPVPWPAALDYAVEEPWREQPDRGGPTDSRLGLNPIHFTRQECDRLQELLPEGGWRADQCKLLLIQKLKRSTHITLCEQIKDIWRRSSNRTEIEPLPRDMNLGINPDRVTQNTN
ncbi:hypothetical protein AVEN_198378-1 [Araneus ventricosus]|uniref:Uncharacterized protein n=1 Tax=Araneus ventricosus TaxID=182803 RepID=A0A4Y2FMD1_ARAVE|nr:hypothetical protein AVEN_198378-1 [Araneus ventricosus]